jgi:hypothetical protein
MSSNNMSSATRTVAFLSRGQIQKTPYCDVCFKKGMPPSQYQSHYPKSSPGPNGVVTCPTILAAKCNYCGKSGHWANEKYCSALRRDKQVRDVDTSSKSRSISKNKDSNVRVDEMKVKNRFAVLDTNSDDEDETIVVNKSVPAVVKPVAIDTSKPTWASMAKKPAVLRPVEKKDNDAAGLTVLTLGNVVATSSTAKSLLSDEAKQEAYKIIAERKAAGNYCAWAMDYDSSDDEDEEW